MASMIGLASLHSVIVSNSNKYIMEEGRNYGSKWVVWDTNDNLDKTEEEPLRKSCGGCH